MSRARAEYRLRGHAVSLGLRTWGTLAFLALSTSGCASHPEGNSGGDAYRNEAQPSPNDEWLSGEINRSAGDTTDWKVFRADHPGIWRVALSADAEKTAIALGVYDVYGRPLAHITRQPGEIAQLKVSVEAAGPLFVKIEHKSGPATAYGVLVTAGEGGGLSGPDL